MSERDEVQDSERNDLKKNAEEQDENFLFDLSEEDAESVEGTDDFADDELVEDPQKDSGAPTGGNALQKVLIPLLLVLILGGIAYYLLADLFVTPEPPAATQVERQTSQKMKIPERTAEPVASPVEEEVLADETVAAVPAESAEDVAQKSVASGTDEQRVEGAPVSEIPLEQAAVATPLPEEEQPAAAVTEETEPVAPVAEDEAAYVLQIGAFAFKKNLDRALSAVEALGYHPQVLTGKKKQVRMLRLRVGAFAPAEAREQLQTLKPLAPGAFLVRDGEQMVLYAGSYRSVGRARGQADLLFEKGIELQEETADLVMPVSVVRFGGFADRATAEKVAHKAKDAGLEILVVKHK